MVRRSIFSYVLIVCCSTLSRTISHTHPFITHHTFTDIDKKKYLVPADLTAGQFVYVIRKRLKLAPEQAIYLFINGTIPPTAALMNTIYQEHKDTDGFMYMTYSGENVFG